MFICGLLLHQTSISHSWMAMTLTKDILLLTALPISRFAASYLWRASLNQRQLAKQQVKGDLQNFGRNSQV
jgi:hypothetical protein